MYNVNDELLRSGYYAKQIKERFLKLNNSWKSYTRTNDKLLWDITCFDKYDITNIEELMSELKQKLSILIVTHNMQQAARISDYTAYMYLGELVEYDATNQIFTNPSKKETEDYITGKFG